MRSIPVPERLLQAEIPAPVREVVEALRQAGFSAYLVGGCVRDLLRGLPPKDFDVATSALPAQVQRAFRKVIPTGIEHGTVTVLSRGAQVEVTTFRSEGPYLDARRPSTVAFETDIKKDLSRRDFTINAMAYDPVGGEFQDPFGGQTDLLHGRIRCVGSALERFTEDGLRPLRGVRLAAVLGFALVPETEAAIPATIASFRQVAVERVREELCKLLLSSRPSLGLRLLEATGLWAEILPELSELPRTFATVESVPAELELRVAALLRTAPAPEQTLLRLKFSGKQTEWICRLLKERGLNPEGGWTDAQLRRLAARVGPSDVPALFRLLKGIRRADLLTEDPLLALEGRLAALLAARPPLYAKDLSLNGQDLMRALQVGPSPLVGEATRFLVEQVLDEPSLNSPEKLLPRLHAWREGKAH